MMSQTYAQTVALCILAAIVTWCHRPVVHVPLARGASARVQTTPPAQPEKMMVAFTADPAPILIEDFATQLRTYLSALKKHCNDLAEKVNTSDLWQGDKGDQGDPGDQGRCIALQGVQGSDRTRCSCSMYPSTYCKHGWTNDNMYCPTAAYYTCCNEAKKDRNGKACVTK